MKSELIKEGDAIVTHKGASVTVTSVDIGRYGSLVKGQFPSGNIYEAYLPYELPSIESKKPWMGWADRTYIILSNDTKVAVVALKTNDPIETLEQYEAKWELMEKENVSMSTLQESNIIRPVY